MPLIEHYSVNVWSLEERRFRDLEAEVRIPTQGWLEVEVVELSDFSNFEGFRSPEAVTGFGRTSPVLHRLHNHQLPDPLDDGAIIYNGIAKDNVKERIAPSRGSRR